LNPIFHTKSIIKQLTLCLPCIITFASVNACWTELHYAVLTKDKQKVEAILTRPGITEYERDILINQPDATDGQTPLHTAVLYSTQEIIEILLKFHPRQDIHDKHGFLPIHYTAAAGDSTGASSLLRNGATPNDLTINHETPLLVAAFNYKWPTAIFFLEAGANPNIQSGSGFSLIFWAAKTQNKMLVRKLLEHDAWTTLETSEGDTPESYANEALLTYMHLYHRKHVLAHDQMIAFVGCIGDSLGTNSPARDMLMKKIYRLLKQNYYKRIECVSSNDI